VGEYSLYAITDNPRAHTGLAIAGVSGQMAHTLDELSQALASLPQNTGIVIITAILAAKSADIIEKHRAKNALPLIVVIPEGSDLS